MGKLRGMMGSVVIFATLILLIVSFWDDFSSESGYNIEDQEGKIGGLTIFEALKHQNFLEGTNKVKSGIEQLTSIGSADFNIIGGLATGAVGVLQTIGGIVTFPLDVFIILTGTKDVAGYYPVLVPEPFSDIIGLIVVLTMAVLFISARLGFDFT